MTSFVISYLLYAHQIPSRKGCTINGNNSLPNGAESYRFFLCLYFIFFFFLFFFFFGHVPLEMWLDVQESK